MSAPLTPSDYFSPILSSARLQNAVNDDLNANDLRRKVVENLRLNFLRNFQPTNGIEIPEPDSLTSSSHNIELVTSLMDRVHAKYTDLVNRPQVFDYYLEESDLSLAENFRNGDALTFLREILSPYLADLAERGICDEGLIEEKYSEFLGMTSGSRNIAAEDFWDSSAVLLYTSHMAYKEAAEKLRVNDASAPAMWFEEKDHIAQNQSPESIRLSEKSDFKPSV